ncbi:coiled-coil domain-containing protein 191 isoform X2 [Rhineura floridana]|uniref:coiled-coil domain-containing protein 191 isoform X2 n=1 Tax=Rhineura floridana TaxID=261503 RepID=UPI002AC81BA0|nr:coiled-coil domain-containing protein 191 isoform X2 [Rhineura floridana]
MAVVRHRPELYRWRRLSQPASRQQEKFDADNVEYWIKRVEQASEFAVSEAFSLKNTSFSRGLHGPVLDLETTEQLRDHDEAYIEAQELLNDWMNSKLKLELASDQDDDTENPAVHSLPSQEPPIGFQKYEKFDDLYGYLEEEIESTTVQDFLQHLLQSEVVDSGILEDLRIEDLKEKRKSRDPRITMELRHKQVKENRLRRQKELELLKQEKALKKSAITEAQKQLQEENKKKVLKARQEEEEIQTQMVKLRKELVERRHLMETVRKMERKRCDLKKTQKLVEVSLPLPVPDHLDCGTGQRKEKQTRMQELLSKIGIANQKCLRKYFSAWYKIILELRIKMGKARALADWKCQLKTLRAWRDYTWSQKLEQETQKMENQLRDQKRKKQLATEFNRKCILHHYFAEWQCWSRTEVEKRELELKKEETRGKMAKLLEEVMLGKFATDCSCDDKRIHETEGAWDQPVSHTEVTELPCLQDDPTMADVERANSYAPGTNQKCDLHSPKKPKWPWQVTLKYAALNGQDCAVFGNQARSSLRCLEVPKQKMSPAFRSPLEHHHAFQQQLIEKQRLQLQEQQQLILRLQESERLKRAKEEAEQATAVTMALNNQAPKIRDGKQLRDSQPNWKNTDYLRSENHQPTIQSRKNLKMLSTPHPLLKAMEERAIQRAERRRELEEAKKKREEDKLVKMQAEEEERQRQEAAEKESQLQKKREERRLQKVKEQEKQRKLEKDQQLLSKAKEHYSKFLLKKKGLEPWKRLIQQTQENTVVAQRHHCFSLQRKCLLAWLHHVQEILAGKATQAGELYSHLLLRRFFRIWIKYKNYASILEENAKKLHETSLKKKVFWAWFDVLNEEKSIFWRKQKIADHYSDRLGLRALHNLGRKKLRG